VSTPYRVAPIFLIRLAGVPFEVIQRLATPAASRAARDLIASRERFASARADAESLLARRDNGLSPEEFRELRAAVRANRAPNSTNGNQPEVVSYSRAAKELAAVAARMDELLTRELNEARSSLLEVARTVLPRYLIFGASGAADLLAESVGYEASARPVRNKRARERERHLLLYLQRLAAKNDTFSEFGPSGWGKIDKAISGVNLAPERGIMKREAFLERWTAHAVAAVINADSTNPAVQVPALEPYVFDVLRSDIEKWPPGATREKWLSILQPIAELPQKFIGTVKTEDRQSILDDARTRLQSLGAEHKTGDRFLYSAANPIAEECFRECHFEIGEKLIDEVAVDAAPWIDLWRDSYSFIASRVAAALQSIMGKAGARNGVMPLPGFLQACEEAKLSLIGPGLIAPAAMAFQEVKTGFREMMKAHSDKAEHELTAADCHFIRDKFQYPKFDEYTYPSADLQLAAKSADDLAAGNYQWILSELHPPIALLHHGGYWSCPDKKSLNAALAQTIAGKPNFHFGFFAADFTSHTTVRIFDALPEFSNFVAPQRGNPNWRTVAPADAEVYVDNTSGDVCLRKIDNREFLGSFARAWVIPLGFHPFQFGMSPHMPRLRCGRVIVQRRSWTVSHDELGPGNYTGVSCDLVLAVERLRAEKDWPRYVYIRPTEQVLRRSGAQGRDKDTKPVFVDLESYLFLEIFHRWLAKAGELEVTEMLPDPDHLFWPESDGRRTFEMRTLIVPRA
jgi:hypothetical protein